MRISTNGQFWQMERAIGQATDRLSLWQRRVSTGRRLEQPSDDPVGSVHALAIRQSLQQIEQYGRNIREARLFLQATEQAFADIGTLLGETRQIVTQGANDTLDADAREALIRQIRHLKERLMQLGNQRADGERYLFAGQRVNTAPFTLSGGVLTYVGDGNPLLAPIAPDRAITMNFTGAARIADLYNKLTEIENHLLTGNADALSRIDLRDIEVFQSEFHRYRGEMGVRLRELQNYETLYAARKEQLQGNLAEIEEIDLTEAISQLRQQELSYQAALQVFTRVQAINLFDFLRGG
ncbi:MAG: flagellar hook-associated protein FlgL [Fimbriimonadales bacterium]|nr:flagellar hook-associated protein FlgL [Fimbriimonadales bacterium]